MIDDRKLYSFIPVWMSLSFMQGYGIAIQNFLIIIKDNTNNIQKRNSRFLQSPHCAANCLQHVRSSGPGAIVCKLRATHRALITCNMSCYVPRGTKGQLNLLSLTEFKLHLFSFILLAEPLNRWRRGGNRSTRRNSQATSFRKCLILKPEDSSPKRDSNPHNSIGGRLGKQTC